MTTRQPVGQAAPRWALLLRPRWLAWHSMVWIATVGMFFLGDWQLHRAESGNELSWAYTFEWPLFAIFTVFFWIKSLRDELRVGGAGSESESGRAAAPAGGAEFTATAESGVATTAATPAASASASAKVIEAAAVPTTRSAPVGRRADTWDATSWDATSWDATGQQTGSDAAGKAVDVARATPADGEAYMARLMAEVQRSGRRGRR